MRRADHGRRLGSGPALRLFGAASLAALAVGSSAWAQTQAGQPPSQPADTAGQAGQPAVTQTAPGPTSAAATVQEVVVHAERRQTRLQDTPIAITAIGAQEIAAKSSFTVGEVITSAPNVAVTSGPTGGNDAFFFIRGIGQTDSNPAFDPGVGVYVDDVYLGLLQGASLDALDISQVEVSRGPQGTLFGRNTIGGAVNIITQDPAESYGGHLRLTAGSRNLLQGFGAVDLPLTSTLRVNVSGYYKKQDGWGHDALTGQTLGDIKNVGARIKAVWDVTNDLQVRLGADFATGRGTAVPTALTGFNPNATTVPGLLGITPLGVPLPNLSPYISKDPFVSYTSGPVKNDLDNAGVSATVRYTHDNLTLKSISAYRTDHQFVDNDFDGTPYVTYDNFFQTREHQFSEELQLNGRNFEDRFNWVIGGYYYHEGVTHNNAICFGGNNGLPPPLLMPTTSGGCIRNNELFTLKVNSYAGFAHFDYKITDRLTLNGGVRYTDDEKNQQYNFFIDNTAGVFSFFGFPPIVIPTVVADRKASFTKATPTVGLDYRFTPNVFGYASYSEGFKSGGFNGRPTSLANIQPFLPETLSTYEVGVKTQWFERRLTANFAGFYSNYKNIQLQVLDTVSGFFNEANAGDNVLTGLEAEIVATPTRNLRLEANFGELANRFTRIDPLAAPSGVFKKNTLPLTPDFTSTLSGEYRIPMQFGDFTLRADYTYRTKVFYSVADGGQEEQGNFGLLNLRAAVGFDHDRYQFAAFGRNVTNVRYKANAEDVLGPLGVAFAEYGPPAEWGVELNARF